MRIHERSAGQVRVMDLDGPITYGEGADVLRSRVRSLLEHGYLQLVINLERVPYMDSAGLGELVQAHVSTARRGGAIKIVNATRRIRDLLVMTRLLSALDTFDDENAAVRSFFQLAQ